jgi:hypothetical protein
MSVVSTIIWLQHFLVGPLLPKGIVETAICTSERNDFLTKKKNIEKKDFKISWSIPFSLAGQNFFINCFRANSGVTNLYFLRFFNNPVQFDLQVSLHFFKGLFTRPISRRNNTFQRIEIIFSLVNLQA